MEEVYGELIEKFCAQGLLVREGDSVRLTDRGIDISNYVMAQFLF
jgi:oxygen-independent coproporphyrinogen-3 oxidase